jgi:hypothetical protein
MDEMNITAKCHSCHCRTAEERLGEGLQTRCLTWLTWLVRSMVDALPSLRARQPFLARRTPDAATNQLVN